jgi:Threonylcarbamoyl-AMP synthase, C-terminal domain
VLQDLNGRIAAVVDGGATSVGVESTVLDVRRDPPMILRPGGVTLEQLRDVIPDVQLYSKSMDGGQLAVAPPTPGLKYRHYSPTGRVLLLLRSPPSAVVHPGEDPETAACRYMAERTVEVIRTQLNADRRVGVLQTTRELTLPADLLTAQQANQLVVLSIGEQNNPRWVFALFLH